MLKSWRFRRCVAAAMALLIAAAAGDLCGHGAGEAPGASPARAEAAAPNGASWAGEGCDAGCPAPEASHADHCAFCPCLCHIAGILPSGDAAHFAASAPAPPADPRLQHPAEYKSGLDRPPILV